MNRVPVDQSPLALLGQPAEDADLALEVHHAVVSPEEIHGVIIVRHRGPGPVALIDRWNSWGGRQWMVVVDGRRVFENPQWAWAANFFTATELRDHGSWAVPFVVHGRAAGGGEDWEFTPPDFAAVAWIDASTGEVHHDPQPPLGFTAATRMQVTLAGGCDRAYYVEKPLAAPIYHGWLCATSQACSESALAGFLQGAQGPLPRLGEHPTVNQARSVSAAGL